jgi:hypothetical protein
MKFLHRCFLRLAADVVALPAVRMARAHAVLLATCSALLSGFPGSPAHAESTAAAEFTLKTCSDAMENFAKVEAAAREDSWEDTSQPITEAMNKYMRGRSMWTVPQGDEIYFVSIYESLRGVGKKPSPYKVCSITFRNRTVRRDEFFNVVSAAMNLTFASETRTPYTRTEMYKIDCYQLANVNISIMSGLDGVVQWVSMWEVFKFLLPSAPPVVPFGMGRC